MTKLFISLCMAVCLAVSMPLSEALAQPASAAKKKKKKTCKKGYKLTTVKKHGKRKRVCKKATSPVAKPNPNPTPTPGPTTDPKAIASSLISGQQFYRSKFSAQSGSGEEMWRFCSDNRYFRLDNFSTNAGTFTETHDNGSWTLTDAKATTVAGTPAYVATLALSGTFDGQPASGNLFVGVSPTTTQSLIDKTGNNAQEFQRSPAAGAC